jgi:hypothetical protein
MLDSTGQLLDVPVNVIGAYSGSFGEHLDDGSYILKILANAAWTVTITQPRNVSGASLPKTHSSRGQQIVGPFSALAAIGIQATNKGSGNFAVKVLDQDGNLLDVPINEIGNYQGSTVSFGLSNGPFYIDILSSGSWTITVSNP